MEGFKAHPTLHKIDGTTRLLRSALRQQPPKLENDAHSVTDERACFNTEKNSSGIRIFWDMVEKKNKSKAKLS